MSRKNNIEINDYMFRNNHLWRLSLVMIHHPWLKRMFGELTGFFSQFFYFGGNLGNKEKATRKTCFVGNKAKRRTSKWVFQEKKARQIFRSAYQEVRKVCFSENLACFVLLKHPFWDSPFCLVTDGFSREIKRLALHIYLAKFC